VLLWICLKLDLHELHMFFSDKGTLINKQPPGPRIKCVTNDSLIISVHNELNEPFLLSCFLVKMHMAYKQFNNY
ncbi:hypothetical protein MKX01_021517, partial [Papaver californicum]